MGRIVGRSTQDNRAALLETATQLMVAQGTAVSLEEIAARARVSKSEMEYHFASKGELITVLAEHQTQAFREEVTSYLNDDDSGAGRLVRAYIRACVNPDTDVTASRTRHTLFVLLSSFPAVPEIWLNDDRWWQWALTADGLPAAVRDVVVAAADGVAATTNWTSAYARARIVRLREELLAMTLTESTPHTPKNPHTPPPAAA